MDPNRILPIYGLDIQSPAQVLQDLDEQTRSNLVIIRGHIPYGLHKEMIWARCLYFTVVRDPVDRIWSLWRYAKRHRSHHLHEVLNELGTLQAAIESGVSPEFNNGMCRQLSGLEGPFPQTPYAETRLPYGISSANELVHAVIDHMQARRISIGSINNLVGFAAMLCELFDWRNKKLQVTNVGPVRQDGDLSDGDLDAIMKYNSGDLYVWDSVKAISE